MYCKIRAMGGCFCILLSLFVGGCGSKDSSNQFTAEMVETMADQSKTSKILVKGLKYRIEQETEGQPFYVLVDQNIGITRVVLPINEQYMEMKSQDPMSLMNDPFQGLKYSMSIGETKSLGTETINGHICNKSVISIQDQEVMTQWVSRKLNFPIKIQNHAAKNMTMELKNIQEGNLDDALFETPAEYTMMTKPMAEPVEIPEWAGEIEAAPVMTPPFDKQMSEGDIIRIKTQPGKSIWLKGKSIGESEAECKAVPFKNGKLLRDLSMYSNFAQKGTICSRHNETTKEADEIIVRAMKGKCNVNSKMFDMKEKLVKAGEEFKVPLNPSQNIEDLRFVNTVNAKSTCTWEYYKDGAVVGEDQVGPKQYRTVTLTDINETKRNALSAKGDEIVFKVEEGEMLIKLGQYDPFKY